MSEWIGDNDAYRFPVSVKGIVVRDRAIVLLRNRRDEWELPGGKLELGESPERCVAREIEEELGLDVEANALVDSWVYTIVPGIHVLMLIYACTERLRRDAMLSGEHTRLEWIALDDVTGLRMPNGYKSSIVKWAERGDARDAAR